MILPREGGGIIRSLFLRAASREDQKLKLKKKRGKGAVKEEREEKKKKGKLVKTCILSGKGATTFVMNVILFPAPSLPLYPERSCSAA